MGSVWCFKGCPESFDEDTPSRRARRDNHRSQTRSRRYRNAKRTARGASSWDARERQRKVHCTPYKWLSAQTRVTRTCHGGVGSGRSKRLERRVCVVSITLSSRRITAESNVAGMIRGSRAFKHLEAMLISE